MISKKLRIVFDKYDSDKSATLEVTELNNVLLDLGVQLKPSELKKILKEVDINNDGVLTFEEFKEIFNDVKLTKVFDDIDNDKNGYITIEEMNIALLKLGYNLDLNSIIKIMNKIDTDKSGVIDKNEFKRFFKFIPANINIIVKSMINSINLDCGTDLSPPIIEKNIPWWYAICGGIGGIISRTLTAPLEKIKIKAQTSLVNINITKELFNTIKKNGVKELWSGNLINCCRVFPYSGIVCYTYLKLLNFTPADNETDMMEPIYRGTCAASAGIIGQITTYPMEVIRTRLTINNNYYKGFFDCFSKTIKQGSIYNGLSSTILTIAPFLAVQMTCADLLKNYCYNYNIEITTPIMMTCASIAGMTAQTIIYPLDVLRRRQMINGGEGHKQIISDVTWMALKKNIREQGGIKGLYNGIIPTYLKVLPSVAIAMTVTKNLISFSKENFEHSS